MRTESVTYTVEYKVFDVGERVKASSPRCALEMGKVYTVTRYVRPRTPGVEPVIFVEGREIGLICEYVVPAEDGA